MKMKTQFLVTIILAFLSIQSINAQKSTWEKPYIGSQTDVLYLPDANAVYWRYGWERAETDENGYVIKGQFPDARYFSFNIYDDTTRSSVGSLTDFNIKADDAKNNYTIYIVPEGTSIKEKNVLYFKKDLTKVSVFLRHYLPTANINGNKPLPQIASFDVKSRTTKEAPNSVAVPKISKEDVDKYLIPMFNKFMENPEANMEKVLSQSSGKSLNIEELIAKQVVENTFRFYKKDSLIHAYNLSAAGTYPNLDNHYLTMPIVRTNKDDVCIVKFKAPNFPKSKNDFLTSDVRYFSLSQGDEMTYNYKTLADYQFIVNPDGYVYVAIGAETASLKAKAKALNINFMPWLVGEKMLLIYRHMLPNPDYKNGTNSVPAMDKSKSPIDQSGDKAIGEYSPIGFFFNKDTFLNSKTIPKF